MEYNQLSVTKENVLLKTLFFLERRKATSEVIHLYGRIIDFLKPPNLTEDSNNLSVIVERILLPVQLQGNRK